MTNYTFEQRKMIAEYLENEILTLEKSWGNIQKITIKNRIVQLKTVTFGDIKNQVGVRFKMRGDFIYEIVKDYGSDHLLILDVKDSVIYPTDYLSDKDKIEVINETEKTN